MKNKHIKLGIVGIAGKMGKAIAHIANEDPKISLNAGSEHKNSNFIGTDVGVFLGMKPSNVLITNSIKSFFKDIDMVIEFGLEDATIRYLKAANKHNVAFLSGSTGLSESTIKLMKKYSKNIPVFWSPNMSIGANILKEIAKETSYKLASDFDIDITDIHHKAKRDTPSGTALSIKGEMEKKLKDNNIKKKISVSAIRAGDSTGEHSIIFSGKGEKIILKHISTSRNIFAHGAIKISKWLNEKRHGYYTFKDFLNIKA